MKKTDSHSQAKFPFWYKSTVILLGLVLIVVVMSYAKFILMPLVLTAFLSMLLNPVVSWLERKKFGRVLSIITTLFLVIVAFVSIISIISVQFVQFSDRIPEVTDRLKTVTTQSIDYLEGTLGLTEEQRSDYFEKGVTNLIDQSGDYLKSIVSATTSAFTLLSLVPIFVFFMLYYKKMYRVFVQKLFERKGDNKQIDEVLGNVQVVTQNYLVGMLTVMGILAILNTLGLFLIGLEHAIFFGVFASLLAVIPYIGIIIGAIPPLLFAFLLGDSLLTPLLVIAVFSVVQFLEGNFITPRIVGSKVSINPFMALLALIIGGEIWGITGMILFVPLIGILRVLFEEIDDLKPYGYLLGNRIEYDTREE